MGKVCLGVSDAPKGLRKAFWKALHLLLDLRILNPGPKG